MVDMVPGVTGAMWREVRVPLLVEQTAFNCNLILVFVTTRLASVEVKTVIRLVRFNSGTLHARTHYQLAVRNH